VAKVPVLPVECWRHKGKYRLVVHAPVMFEPGDSDAEITQRIATGLEAAIRRNPEWWYPFGEIYQQLSIR
jgi:lauroyl/myristoyl acyltransferase